MKNTRENDKIQANDVAGKDEWQIKADKRQMLSAKSCMNAQKNRPLVNRRSFIFVEFSNQTTLSAQEELANASGLALKTKPIPRIYPIASFSA